MKQVCDSLYVCNYSNVMYGIGFYQSELVWCNVFVLYNYITYVMVLSRIVCTLQSFVLYSLVGHNLSLRFFGREYAIVHFFIVISFPFGCGK